ncbi:MAG: hypothetical protein ACO3E1_08540 [Flavobacteriales bacterium]
MLNLKEVKSEKLKPVRLSTEAKSLFGIALLFFVFSCKKETTSTAPSIEFVSITPSSVKVGEETVNITISYKDADGDLGENNSDVKNMFVTDNRNGVVYQFRIQQLAPSGSSISIQGNLSVAMPNTGISDGVSSESATFSVYVKDRAGNESNSVSTSAITVLK